MPAHVFLMACECIVRSHVVHRHRPQRGFCPHGPPKARLHGRESNICSLRSSLLCGSICAWPATSCLRGVHER